MTMTFPFTYASSEPFIAATYAGLEQVLAGELVQIGAKEVTPVRRAVTFKGAPELVYKANYSLRTALRILVPLKVFKIKQVDDLYHQAQKIKWEDIFDSGRTFAVQSNVYSRLFTNSMYASLKLKDAIVDRFRHNTGRRPSIDVQFPDIVVNLHITEETCTISLDSSGESLHKRGYRVGNHEAPISEVLAAGLLKLSGWNGAEPLLDPMCGSGTIAIEAAMMAKNIMPGEIGRKYCFMNWNGFDKAAFDKITASKQHIEPDFFIYGADISKRHIDLAIKNSTKANVDDMLRLKTSDFKDLKKNTASFLLFNPPYGERLNAGDQTLYNMIGERLKHEFTDTTVWIISTAACFKSIGLKPSQKIAMYNGALECSFRKFELYQGSKKELLD